MAEYKFDVGDVVVCYYPHNKIYGKAYIVASRRHINGFARAYYELKDLHGLFVETLLEPVEQTLEPKVDLKTLFGGGE